MGKLTSIERAERSLATRTSRRSFLGRVGRGVVALAGGGLVATAIAPDRAQAYHICGHTYTTGSCPHPYSPLSRTDRYGYPMHPQYGYPVDDEGKKYVDPRSQTRRKTCEQVVPEAYPFTGSPRYGGGGPGAARAGCATSRTAAPGRTSASTGTTRCVGTALAR